MRVALTGAAGNLGSFIWPKLVEAGHQVVLIDRAPLKQALAADSCCFMEADLTNPYEAYRVLEGCEGVIHAGALRFARFPLDGQPHRNNHLSTFNLLEAASNLGVSRFIFVSSVQACGLFFCDHLPRPPYLPIDETLTELPVNTYGLAKRFGEMSAQLCVNLNPAFSVISIRFPLLIPHFQEFQKVFTMTSANPPNYARHYWLWASSQDAAETVTRLLELPHQGHTVVYAASHEPYCQFSWRQLREAYFADIPWRGGDPEGHLLNLAKLETIIGQVPDAPWRRECLLQIDPASNGAGPKSANRG